MSCHGFCLAIFTPFFFCSVLSDLGDTLGASVSRPFHVAGCTCNICDSCFVLDYRVLIFQPGVSLRPAESLLENRMNEFFSLV